VCKCSLLTLEVINAPLLISPPLFFFDHHVVRISESASKLSPLSLMRHPFVLSPTPSNVHPVRFEVYSRAHALQAISCASQWVPATVVLFSFFSDWLFSQLLFFSNPHLPFQKTCFSKYEPPSLVDLNFSCCLCQALLRWRATSCLSCDCPSFIPPYGS